MPRPCRGHIRERQFSGYAVLRPCCGRAAAMPWPRHSRAAGEFRAGSSTPVKDPARTGWAPDRLLWYSARPRTSMTRAGGTKGMRGAKPPTRYILHTVFEVHMQVVEVRIQIFTVHIWCFDVHIRVSTTIYGFRRPYRSFRCPKIEVSSSKMTPRGRKSVLTTSKMMFEGRES